MKRLALLLGLLPSPAAACDLALVLAVDVSGSVDKSEYRVQMDGLAAGLRDGIVVEALVDAQAQVMLIQWSGSSRQQVSVPWTSVHDFAQAEALAQKIEAAPRQWSNYATAIGEALGLATDSFAEVPHCRRKVVDVSGDGLSNEGVDPRDHHRAMNAQGIVVNALAIEGRDDDLTAYFFENVITGEGAFVVTANGFEDYPARIRRKLQRETTKQLSGNHDQNLK